GWHRDAGGQVVATRRLDAMLDAMNRSAEGVLISPDAPDPAGDVRRALERLDRRTVRDQLAADLVPRAWIFALVAALLLALHSAPRRTAALASLALLFPATGWAQRPTQGWQWLLRGDTVRATAAFMEEAQRSNSDTAWYNAGTAAVAAGDLAGAIPALERASVLLDPALPRQAVY